MPIVRPFHESNLGDQFRHDPLHLFHLFGSHSSTPTRCSGMRQIDERTRGMQRLQYLEYLSSEVWSQSSSHLRREAQILPLVISDQQRIHPEIPWSITSDHELLLFLQLQLHPRPTPLTCVVAPWVWDSGGDSEGDWPVLGRARCGSPQRTPFMGRQVWLGVALQTALLFSPHGGHHRNEYNRNHDDAHPKGHDSPLGVNPDLTLPPAANLVAPQRNSFHNPHTANARVGVRNTT